MNYRITQRDKRKDETRLSAIIDDTGKENFEDKILKEGENCNIPDQGTLARTHMQIQLSKTLDVICNILVGNPNLGMYLYWYAYLACKHIVLMTSEFYCGDNWPRI